MPSPSFFWEVSGQIYALCSLRTREGGQINSLYNICIVFKIADIYTRRNMGVLHCALQDVDRSCCNFRISLGLWLLGDDVLTI